MKDKESLKKMIRKSRDAANKDGKNLNENWKIRRKNNECGKGK